jgi:hypothetical protein
MLDERAGRVNRSHPLRNDHGPRADHWETDVLPKLRDVGAPRLVELTGFSRSAVYAVLSGARPRTEHRIVYGRIAANADL